MPLPDAVKQNRGTLRKHRQTPNAPRPRPGVPQPPKWLGPEARAEWKRIVPQLQLRGLLEVMDRALLVSYVTAWEELVVAQRELLEQGSTTVTSRGAIVAHPALKRAQVARQQIHRFGLEFGIGPSARTRVRGNPAAAYDPVAEARRRKYRALGARSPEEAAAERRKRMFGTDEEHEEAQARRFFGSDASRDAEREKLRREFGGGE